MKRNYNDETTWEQMLQERDEKDKLIAALTKERDELKKELQELKACRECGGTGGVDSGGMTPWGAAISLPCPSCSPKSL